MNSSKTNEYNLTAIKQIAYSMVNNWMEDRKIVVRPGDKKALINTLSKAIPAFLETNNSNAFHSYVESIRREERQFCIEMLNNMQEPFPGLLNKQRAINSCTYVTDLAADKKPSTIENMLEPPAKVVGQA